MVSDRRDDVDSDQDPIKRLTAAAMLKHPWTTGETASEKVMEGVDEKLASFQEVPLLYDIRVQGFVGDVDGVK